MTEKPNFNWKIYPKRIEFINNTNCNKIPKMYRMTNQYELIESDPCKDPYDCRKYIGILKDGVEELYSYKDICEELNRLTEENKQLKKEVQWWKYRCGENIQGDLE